MALTVTLNGRQEAFEGLNEEADLGTLIQELGLKVDRIAVEHNGEIARRGNWNQLVVRSGDKLEIVHFVGGG